MPRTRTKTVFHHCLRSLVVGLVLSGWAGVVVASEEDVHPLLTSGISVDLGMFFPDRELDLSVSGSLSPNEEIDFDTGFSLGNADRTWSGEMAWRFRNRWSFLAQYFKSSDSSSVTLSEDVEWEDVVFGAGTNAVTGTSLSLTRLFVGRHWDISGEHQDLGVGGGIHWLSINAFIEGTIISDGNETFGRRSASTEGALPNIGVWYRYSISPRWAFRTRFDVLKANIGRYSGLLLNGSMGIDFHAVDRFGVGVSYNYFELDVKIDQSDWRGKVETIYDGAYVHISVYF